MSHFDQFLVTAIENRSFHLDAASVASSLLLRSCGHLAASKSLLLPLKIYEKFLSYSLDMCRRDVPYFFVMCTDTAPFGPSENARPRHRPLTGQHEECSVKRHQLPGGGRVPVDQLCGTAKVSTQYRAP